MISRSDGGLIHATIVKHQIQCPEPVLEMSQWRPFCLWFTCAGTRSCLHGVKTWPTSRPGVWSPLPGSRCISRATQQLEVRSGMVRSGIKLSTVISHYIDRNKMKANHNDRNSDQTLIKYFFVYLFSSQSLTTCHFVRLIIFMPCTIILVMNE